MPTLGKSAGALVAASALALSATVSTELPASAASSGCRINFKVYSHVEQGDRGMKTRAAQCLLRRAGYSVRVDGSFSWADEAAVKRFQYARGIPRPNGEVGRRTWTALLARGSRPHLSTGSHGDSVRRLQRALTASHHRVPVTGYFGSQTRAAVKSVQRARGLRSSGVASTSLWRVLQNGSAAGRSSHATKKPSRKKSSHSSSSSSRGARAVAFAKRQIGDRYRYGATGPSSWDCSGLTSGAWRSAGVSLPHSSRAQYRRGKYVSRSNLRLGDLVFFYSGPSHVGIYAGNGRVIHASRPGKPVGYEKISYMPYKGARRVG